MDRKNEEKKTINKKKQRKALRVQLCQDWRLRFCSLVFFFFFNNLYGCWGYQSHPYRPTAQDNGKRRGRKRIMEQKKKKKKKWGYSRKKKDALVESENLFFFLFIFFSCYQSIAILHLRISCSKGFE